MAHFISDLKNSFKRSNTSLQFIYINVGVFIIVSLLGVLFLLFNRTIGPGLRYFELPASFFQFLRQPWSLFSYMFMHAGLFHILFNMLWLYWFGNLFLNFFSAKHFRGLYLLGGIMGGLLYMIAYNIFPYFQSDIPFSYLVGASASVLAIVVAVAYKEPDYQVRLLFIGAVRLKYLALFMILTDLLLMTSSNAGGHIAHLGGALSGLWFAASLSKGKDVTKWMNQFLDWFMSLFQKSGKKKYKAKMKVHQANRSSDYDYNATKKAQSDEVDRILEKLKRTGYQSLSSEEKKKLFDASKK